MFCKYCGEQVEDNSIVCPHCEKQLEDTVSDVDDGEKSKETDNYTPKMEHINDGFKYERVLVEDSQYGGSRRVLQKKDINPKIIIGAVCLILVIALGVFSSVFFLKGGKLVSFKKTTNGMYFEIEQIPANTSTGNIQLSGVINAKDKEATLVINGDVIESVTPEEGEKKWTRNFVLKPGNNKFVMNVSDGEKTTPIKVVNVEYEPVLRFPKGTVLVKADPSDIFIRPTPGKSGSYVMLIYSSDYSTQLICEGEEVPDGANVWCKVKTPSKGVGWVRSDLIRAK